MSNSKLDGRYRPTIRFEFPDTPPIPIGKSESIPISVRGDVKNSSIQLHDALEGVTFDSDSSSLVVDTNVLLKKFVKDRMRALRPNVNVNTTLNLPARRAIFLELFGRNLAANEVPFECTAQLATSNRAASSDQIKFHFILVATVDQIEREYNAQMAIIEQKRADQRRQEMERMLEYQNVYRTSEKRIKDLGSRVSNIEKNLELILQKLKDFKQTP